MVGDFLRLLLDFIEFLWPLKRIEQYEEGVVMVLGRYKKTVGPGVYFRVPWFTDVHAVSVVWGAITTGRNDITMKDGKTLSFAANSLCRVVNAQKAMIDIHDHENGMHVILSSVLAERLAEIDPERLAPDKRARLNTDLRKWVEQEAAEFGVEVKWVRFTSFVVNPRTYRLLAEQIGQVG